MKKAITIGLLAVCCARSEAGAIPLSDGDIVVLEQGGSPVEAALIRIDPVTGNQEVISSGDLLSTGQPSGFAYDHVSGSLFTVGRDWSLIEVDPTTGQQTLITNLPGTGSATGIAIEANGDFLVTDYGGRSIFDAHGRLLRVSRDDNSVSVLAQGEFLDSIAAISVQIDRSGSPIVSGFGDDVSSVIRVDPITGHQDLLASISTGSFYDFSLSGKTAYIALSSHRFPNMDQVAALDLETGRLTTVFRGLQRVIDVDFDAEGRLVVLDQCRSPSPCGGSPVVYRSNSLGGLDVVSENGFMSAPGGLTVVLPAQQNRFRRGDANADRRTDISDAVTILAFLFLGGAMNDCQDAADVNDDGQVDISDSVRLLGHLFLGSERPPDPFDACGVDSTADALDCSTVCVQLPPL